MRPSEDTYATHLCHFRVPQGRRVSTSSRAETVETPGPTGRSGKNEESRGLTRRRYSCSTSTRRYVSVGVQEHNSLVTLTPGSVDKSSRGGELEPVKGTQFQVTLNRLKGLHVRGRVTETTCDGLLCTYFVRVSGGVRPDLSNLASPFSETTTRIVVRTPAVHQPQTTYDTCQQQRNKFFTLISQVL